MEIDQSLDLKRDHAIDKLVLYGATALFGLTIVLTTLQVFIRWLDLPTFGFLHWTEPAARFVLIVATYVGAAVAVRNNEHIAIQFLLERLTRWKPRIGLTVQILGKIVGIGFLAIVFWGTTVRALDDWATSIGGIGVVTSGHLYLGISVGIGLMLLYAVVDIVELVRSDATAGASNTVESGFEEGVPDE